MRAEGDEQGQASGASGAGQGLPAGPRPPAEPMPRTDMRGLEAASSLAEAAAAPVPTMSGAEPATMPGARRRGLTRANLVALGHRGRDRWLAASDNLRGSALMIASILVFSVMMAGIKEIGTGLPLTQILLIRQILLTLLILPFFKEDLSVAFRTGNLGMQLLRGCFSLGSQYTYFLAVLYLPLAEMTALGFSQVIFMTVAAVVVLKETVGIRRWAATAVGFVGVIVMLKPGADVLNPYALVAILSALLLCVVTLFIRILAKTESTTAMILYQSAVLCAAYLGPALWYWEWPTPKEWILLLVVGVVGTAGQYLFTMAFKVGETAAIAPLEFVRLILAVLIGYLFFSEVPDAWTMVGATIVIGATIYTVRRNAGS